LSHQIAHVQGRAVQYVVLSEGVARSARRIEPFFDVDPQGDDDVLETPVARARNVDFERSVDLYSSVNVPQVEPNVRRLRERVRGERRNLDPFVEGHRMPRGKQRTDIDYQC